MQPAKIIDGKAAAERLRARVAQDTARLWADRGVRPGLAVVLVGDDAASAVYVRSKEQQAQAVGMTAATYLLPTDAAQDEVLALVARLNADPAVHGVLVQLPLPPQIDAKAVIAAVDPEKDVDGLTPLNIGRLASGMAALAPCTPLGCMSLLREALGDLTGLHAVVIGRSQLNGRPLAQMLLQANCTVTIAHSQTRDLPAICKMADILVAAAGQAELVRGDWLKPGVAVIDVGINRVPAKAPEAAAAGKMRTVGDVAFDEALPIAGWITPVPGGVGPMTVASLLANTLLAAQWASGA